MSWCAATINPPQVMAISCGPDVMVPSAWHADPPPPPHSAHVPSHLGSRPQVGHTTVALRAGNIASPSLPPRSGYTTQHARYNQELERWAKRSFAAPPAETISLKIAAHYETTNAKRARNQSMIFGVSLIISI